jgi:hypothetical protein
MHTNRIMPIAEVNKQSVEKCDNAQWGISSTRWLSPSSLFLLRSKRPGDSSSKGRPSCCNKHYQIRIMAYSNLKVDKASAIIHHIDDIYVQKQG